MVAGRSFASDRVRSPSLSLIRTGAGRSADKAVRERLPRRVSRSGFLLHCPCRKLAD